MNHLLALLKAASTLPFYLLVAASAAAQNFIPLPILDIAVLFAAFVMAAAHASGFGVFLAAWSGNAGTAAVMYGVARFYSARFEEPRVVRWILKRQQSGQQRDWQVVPVFISSFLPVRPLLPILAGLAAVPLWRLLVPIAVAAGFWYGGLVFVGAAGGHNFKAVMHTFAVYRARFGIAALVLTLAAGAWWLLRRRRSR